MKLFFTLCISCFLLISSLQGQSFHKSLSDYQTWPSLVVGDNRIYTIHRDTASAYYHATALVITDTLGVHVETMACDSFQITDIKKTDDNGFLLRLEKNILAPFDPSYVSLLKTDSAFNFHWQKSAIDTNFGGPVLIASGKDGSIYGAGIHQLMNMDLNGNLNWSKEYGNFGFGQIVPTADSGIFASGMLDTSECFVKINKTGSVEWAKSFSGFELAGSIATDGDNHYVLLHNQRQVPFYLSTIIIKLDGFGNIIWSKKYEEVLDDIEARTLIVLSDHSIYIGGLIYHLTAFFAHLDSSGIPISANKPVNHFWYYNIAERHGFYYFGLLLAGANHLGYESSIDSMKCGGSTPFSLSYYSSPVILADQQINTSSGGTLVDDSSSFHNIPWTIIDECSTTGVPDMEESSISIFPNPGTGSFVFSFPGEGKVNLTIVDEMGRPVFNSILPGGGKTVDLNLLPGIYIYHLEGRDSENGKRKTGKLIIQ